jgi:hypothetical protein
MNSGSRSYLITRKKHTRYLQDMKDFSLIVYKNSTTKRLLSTWLLRVYYYVVFLSGILNDWTSFQPIFSSYISL